MLHEFDLEIKDKKWVENLATDHLSRLEEVHKNVLEKRDINDTFPREQLYSIKVVKEEETP